MKFFKKSIPILLITSYSLLVTASFANAALVPCGTEKYPAGTTKVIDGKTVDVSGQVSNPCTICDFFVLIKNIVDFLVEAVAMPVAVVVLIYGGIMMVTSAGSEEKIRKGKTALWYAIWGLLIVLAAWLIIDTIIKWLGAGGQGVIQGWGPWNSIPGCN